MPHDAPVEPNPARRHRRRSFDILIGAGVLLISLVSLFVAVSANRTQERMLAASVWPSLQFGTSNASPDGATQITLDLLNRGIGPARIRWAELRIGDQPVRSLRELLATCCAFQAETTGFSSGLQRRVLGSDEWIHLVRLPQADNDATLWAQLDTARHQIHLRACYCSVLDDCWLFGSRIDEAEPASECPAPPAILWGE